MGYTSAGHGICMRASTGQGMVRCPALAQTLVKDADDAPTLVAVVLGQCVVVVAMMGLGFLWAMVWGWQLTLVGVAIGPVFAAMMGLQTELVGRSEVWNKCAHEEVTRVYYESILNFMRCRSSPFCRNSSIVLLRHVLRLASEAHLSRCVHTALHRHLSTLQEHFPSTSMWYLSLVGCTHTSRWSMSLTS